MTAHEYFGCRVPPFDSRPDPSVFFAGEAYEEAVSTLEFAATQRKGCCLILGESGSGKSTVLRQAIHRLRTTTHILLVQSIGQPRDALVGVAYVAGVDTPPGSQHFDEWIAQTGREPHPRLLLVDDADELPAGGWRKIVAHLASSCATDHPVTIALCGAPTIRDGLTKPRLMRITRRVFRTCRLPRLTPQGVRKYIETRLRCAGADPRRVFTADAVAMIFRMTRGVPAFVNQVCDNAMLEAFSEDRKPVSAEDVARAVYAIAGGGSGARRELDDGRSSPRATVTMRLPECVESPTTPESPSAVRLASEASSRGAS
ncbi:MAG: hypothetical protein D6744_09975, partial [Planctomycetota bacterium]